MIYQFVLSDLEFRLLRDLVHERFGLYFRDEKRSFVQMKLYPRVVGLGLGSFSEYLQLVRYGPDGTREMARMISCLTNNETYFFREMPQLNVFRDVLLPELREKKLARGDKTARILSAGCSTGEEVYTLAMLAFETGGFFWGWDLQIIGMDIDETALQTAREGGYYERSFRMTDPQYITRYFSPNSGNVQARDNIKRMTSFIPGNIADPRTWDNLRDFDVIFCRNVLIYFSPDKIKEAIANLHRALAPGGYLLLGHSETLTGICDDFEIKRFPETFVYRKKE